MVALALILRHAIKKETKRIKKEEEEEKEEDNEEEKEEDAAEKERTQHITRPRDVTRLPQKSKRIVILYGPMRFF